jgi:hypothetical protein
MGKMPDLTLAQILAGLTTVIGLFASQGLITNQQEKLITGIAAVVLPIVLVAADAVIRHGRSRALAPHPAQAPPTTLAPPSAAPQPPTGP